MQTPIPQKEKDKFTPEDFTYNQVTDKLICPAGKRLYSTGKAYRNPEGYTVDSFRASKADCQNCSLKKQCLKNPEQTSPRQVRLFNGKPTDTLTAKMKEKIDTPQGRKIYSQRLGIVEPVFGNLAAQKGLNRSTLRGTHKVNIQWKLFTMIANLEKIAKYGSGLN
ncbi:MAG: transposase [Verrucomicrobiota bacterium]